jgi:N-terminal domain of anti-restriction factor ArdC
MDNQTKWTELLQAAVTEPGMILKAYSNFHGYSLGNQIAAMVQCQMRNLEIGPINTYPGWKRLDRQVRKGEKAIWLCMPLTRKIKDKESNEDQTIIATFVWKPNWFVLSQTNGEPVSRLEIPTWNKERALTALSIQEVPFVVTNGNVQGYARKREVAILSIAAMPHKTLLHELAHIELGHTVESEFTDSEQTPRNLREVEAEAVAMLLCESLELPGAEFCRGYIQSWLKGDVIPEKSAMKIFGAADRILKAGWVNNYTE